MKSQALTAGAIIACLLTAAPIVAKDKAPKDNKGKSAKPKLAKLAKVEAVAAAPQLHAEAASPQAKAARSSASARKIVEDKEPWVSVNVRIGDPEREVNPHVSSISARHQKERQRSFRPDSPRKSHAAVHSLPVGRRNVCAAKSCRRKSIANAIRFRRKSSIKLPPPPPGTILVAVHGKIVRLVKASREILDVFDVIIQRFSDGNFRNGREMILASGRGRKARGISAAISVLDNKVRRRKIPIRLEIYFENRLNRLESFSNARVSSFPEFIASLILVRITDHASSG